MTDRWFFNHGGDYANTTGVPRERCCGTCAFKAGPGTVRPEGVTPDDVFAQTDFCDDFVCHTPNEDGSYPSCPGWHAHHAREMADLGERRQKREAEQAF